MRLSLAISRPRGESTEETYSWSAISLLDYNQGTRISRRSRKNRSAYLIRLRASLLIKNDFTYTH